MIADQPVRSQKPTRIPTHFGCRARRSFQRPRPIRLAAPAIWSQIAGTVIPSSTMTNTIREIARACPRAIGTSAANSAFRDRSCKPSPTANSQPIAGFSPCHAPRPTNASQSQADPAITPDSGWKTIGVRRGITPVKVDLVETMLQRGHIEITIERQRAVATGISLH